MTAVSHTAELGEPPSLHDRNPGHVTSQDVQSALSQPYCGPSTSTRHIKRAAGGGENLGRRPKHRREADILIRHDNVLGVPPVPPEAIFVGHDPRLKLPAVITDSHQGPALQGWRRRGD